MSVANPLPPNAEQTLQAWLDDPAVQAALQASTWKEAFASYTYLTIEEPPAFAPFRKPFHEATIGIITTGGLYIEGEQPAFNAADVYGDASLRLIPIETPRSQLRIAHDHYDHTVPEQDLRTIDPTLTLQVLAEQGVIGAVSPIQISAHGYIPMWTRVLKQLIPATLEALRSQPQLPDGVVLVPV